MGLGCNVSISFLVCCFNNTANFRLLLFLFCNAFPLQEPLSTASTFEDPQCDVKVSHSTLFACSCMFFLKDLIFYSCSFNIKTTILKACFRMLFRCSKGQFSVLPQSAVRMIRMTSDICFCCLCYAGYTPEDFGADFSLLPTILGNMPIILVVLKIIFY